VVISDVSVDEIFFTSDLNENHLYTTTAVCLYYRMLECLTVKLSLSLF